MSTILKNSLLSKERFILKKHGIEININSRIVAVLERTSMLLSIFLCYHLASKGRSHLLLGEPGEDRSTKKLKSKLMQKEKEFVEPHNKIEKLKKKIVSL